jgi:hypothetical protein
LLISADFMASEFIINQELPPLLATAEKDGATILPVIISPCSFERTALAQFQSVNSPSKPLLGMSKVKQEGVWQQVVVRIDQLLKYVPTDTSAIHVRKHNETSLALKLFISYSHKDEELKDELVTMLAGLQRRGIIDAWQNRPIEPGDEWHKSIQTAMDEYDLAILLISPDYLASRFIKIEEQPKLLLRREEIRLRVIPIIVRPCMWGSEPVLKDIQALPKDGKPVITFPIDTGARDQVWTNIATAIEKRAKATH